MRVIAAMELENALKKEIRKKTATLHDKTKALIEGMSKSQALAVLEEKWITPIIDGIMELPEILIKDFITKLVVLSDKYAVTLSDVGTKIEAIESDVSGFISRLRGDAFDMKGLAELEKLLGGERQ